MKHSNRMPKALLRAKTGVEYFEYEQIDHYFDRNEDRIDMLEKTGRFLEKHLEPRAKAASAAASAH